MTGEDADGVPDDATNLAARAALALATFTGREAKVRIEIRKGIPVAGGMAGGSADAAAALVACDALWETDVGPAALHELASRLGSDVPFCLIGGNALGAGQFNASLAQAAMLANQASENDAARLNAQNRLSADTLNANLGQQAALANQSALAIETALLHDEMTRQAE